jgi:hypothetical protein
VIVPLEKPGTPEELVHFGVRGMKWGVRKSQSSGSSGSIPKKMSTKKKVAIGVGGAVLVAGAAFATYKLKSNGKLPILEVGKAATGKSGQLYVSNLSNKQWDTKIASQKMRYAAMSRSARRRADRNLLRSLPKSDPNIDWVAVFKKNNPGILK